MKKLFFLTALLCASVMSFAADYCDAAMTSTAGSNATVTMRLVSGTLYEFAITTEDNITSFNAAGSNFYANVNGVGGYHVSEHLVQNGNTLSVQFESSSVPSIYANVLFIVLEGKGENQFEIPMDASWATCGAVKTDPELALNATEKTLDASISETFQIVANQIGDGAITYVSDKPGIASVDADGLVTAVGRGTATISVKTAETETYAAAIKKLVVTVNGPISWDGLDWLAGSNDKYKLVVTPEIADNFGGKHVQGSDLWIGFPSAAFGEMSIEPSAGDGAWKTFALSNFPNKVNQFTVECGGTTYTFDVYFVDGAEIPTAISHVADGAKAIKMIEDGKLIIIKNGVRYDATGQVIR